MGRNKIQIQPITDDRQRCITFNKRKVGLLKKACELAVLCDIQIVLSFTDLYNNVYNFVAPDAQAIESTKKSSPGAKIYNMKVIDYPQFSKRVTASSEPNLSLYSSQRKTIKSQLGLLIKRNEVIKPLEQIEFIDKLKKKQKLNLKIQIPDDDKQANNYQTMIRENVSGRQISQLPHSGLVSQDGTLNIQGVSLPPPMIKSPHLCGINNQQVEIITMRSPSPFLSSHLQQQSRFTYDLQNVLIQQSQLSVPRNYESHVPFTVQQIDPRILFLVDLKNQYQHTQNIAQQQKNFQGNYCGSNLSSGLNVILFKFDQTSAIQTLMETNCKGGKNNIYESDQASTSNAKMNTKNLFTKLNQVSMTFLQDEVINF